MYVSANSKLHAWFAETLHFFMSQHSNPLWLIIHVVGWLCLITKNTWYGEKHILIYEVHGTQTQLEMSLMSGKNTWFCAQNMANYLTSSKMASNRFILKTVVSHSSHHHHPSSSLDVKSAPARLIWIWYDTFCRHVDMICTECINQPKCSVSVDNRNIQLHIFFSQATGLISTQFQYKVVR